MSSNPARPKRAAEEFVRTHQDDTMDGQPSKKPRFDVRNPSALAPDALEDDAILDADVIGGRGQQVRRNAVNIDGYDSDSENEGFDGRVEAKKAREKEAQSKAEEENDMFADLEDDLKDGDESMDEPGTKSGKKKAVRFLEEDEIEGQIKSSKSGGHVSVDFSNGRGKGKAKDAKFEDDGESSSDSEVGDEVRASIGDDIDMEIGAGGKKTHAPKLDAFNMKTEQEDGRFDDQGNYVRKAADPDAKHDTWLEGVSKKDMKKAKEAADKREEERRKRDVEDDAKLTSDVLKTLIPLLDRGETILEALARLGKGREKKPRWATKNKKKTSAETGDIEMMEDESPESRRRAAIEKITEAADILLTRGQLDIYEAERELLIRQYRRETGEEWTDAPRIEDDKEISPPKSWEYRWSDARDGGEVHGPYDGPTMVQWNDAGYFGEGVEFREKDGGSDWNRVVDFV